MAQVDPQRLMIFPLPGAVLFPHAVLPLHVFEPRYRQLLADCLAGPRAFAIACIDGPADAESPRVRSLVGVGSVVAHEPLPDGRANILLKGLGRARIEAELPAEDGRLYRVVQARWEEDDPLPPGRDEALRQTLAALANQLAGRLPEGGDTLRALVQSQQNAGALSDLLAAALVTDPRTRLRVFETLDVSVRSDRVAEAIGIALASLQESAPPKN